MQNFVARYNYVLVQKGKKLVVHLFIMKTGKKATGFHVINGPSQEDIGFMSGSFSHLGKLKREIWLPLTLQNDESKLVSYNILPLYEIVNVKWLPPDPI